MNLEIPVLTIDGPSGSGKGTASRAVAQRLGWNFLDSGAIYRSLAVAVLRAGVPLDAVDAIVRVAEAMDLSFTADDPPKVLLDGENIAGEIHTETCGNAASRIAAHGPVRQALLQKQRDFRRAPGLVADGRDMGTVVFPEAVYKVFLTASAGVRALRRHKQLKEKGIDVSLGGLTREIEERDRRDRERAEAPLLMAEGAVLIDSSALTIDEVVVRCLAVVGL
ncbi:cytidylate kinase [Methylomagnum ishizawai]|uniref:Cytidylate kinase n=1 Tax=Methylomagnum ishizawai TaxID=1760988 RepID=A0A1Y6CVY4_9GAMM|nr:(d)CMP kinase [Methylomagnum ishizawai]SMF94808.1 cytidylate kinase [Methylomagnum ishizawai]